MSLPCQQNHPLRNLKTFKRLSLITLLLCNCKKTFVKLSGKVRKFCSNMRAAFLIEKYFVVLRKNGKESIQFLMKIEKTWLKTNQSGLTKEISQIQTSNWRKKLLEDDDYVKIWKCFFGSTIKEMESSFRHNTT